MGGQPFQGLFPRYDRGGIESSRPLKPDGIEVIISFILGTKNIQAAATQPKSTFRTLRYFLKLHPWKSVIVSLFLMISGLFEGLGAGAILPLLTIVIRGRMEVPGAIGRFLDRILALFGAEASIGFFLFMIIAAFLLKSVTTFLAMRYAARTAAAVAADLRISLLLSVTRAKWDFFLGHPLGDFSSAIGIEAEQAADSYLSMCKMLSEIIQAAAYLGIAFAISWKVSLFALLIGAVGIVILDSFVKRMRQASVHFVSHFRSVINHLVDSLQGLKPLKAMGLEDRTETLIASDIDGLKKARVKMDLSGVALNVLREPFLMITAAAGFYFAVRVLRIRFEDASVSLLIFTQILSCFSRLQNYYQQLVRSESMFWAARALIEEASGAAEVISGGAFPVFEKHVRLCDLSFSRGKKKIMENVFLDIPAGRMTMLIGPSGSGKTTIADLLVGLITPMKGEVRIDSVPLAELDLRAWRSLVGYVPQELFLFHDTILRNVSLGDTKVESAEVEAALRRVGAWDFVAALPGGILSVVGERGAKLSGGQRQRIAIARALVRKPRFLILDEATSGLDGPAEEALFENLLSGEKKLTLLVISHRSSVSRKAENIYAFEEGSLRRLRQTIP